MLRFSFDKQKSGRLRSNTKRGIGFEEAKEIFAQPYFLDQRSDNPEQYRAIGWFGRSSLLRDLRIREDDEGEVYHLITLWKSTQQEQQLYVDQA